MRGLEIKAVDPQGQGALLGLRPGDLLLRVDENTLRDIIDFYFYTASGRRLFLRRDGRELVLRLPEPERPWGLDFAHPFGSVRRCANRCLFCFVDQQPPGLRPTLSFKDDDYRLSFWEGNFTTLTNCTRKDLERIVEQRLSPLYISVHTTNPQLRAKLMGNPRAGLIMEQLKFLAAGGITLHTQIVLCPGINDGVELERTVEDLASLYPAVASIAVVPVGLTRYRQGLYPLRPVSREEAALLLEKIHSWQRKFHRCWGTRLVYAADELYLLAGSPLPPASAYEGFPQLENGVGLARQFLSGWEKLKPRLPREASPLRAVIVTGVLAAGLLEPVVARLNKIRGLEVELVVVENEFFGPTVTVAGLLTGRDIRRALLSRPRPDLVMLPAVALKDGHLFLDDLTLDELAAELGCRVEAAGTPEELVQLTFQEAAKGGGKGWENPLW
ncbi:protein of unknown function DUF512 [Ammonifex degensii KC4]|uniref:Uncharacterized protein n=1 Tax=Ammonifex degensii (strain DSM 10501 / KC4) TaxID=429009 RepID=C9R7Q7_AMMDK|nr:DUF512 domain-containing protein [Ammonifex degensii]ACX52336.1 protein of unknown function DUF512 [Ammonifex degensii KC4]